MKIMEKIEKYSKDGEFSFSLGAYPSFELIKNMPAQAKCVLIHSKAGSEEINKLTELCRHYKIEVRQDDKTIARLSSKENCYVVGVFKKYAGKLNSNKQIVLVNPSDMGNLGTIMRTIVGFGYTDLVIIKPAVDYFNPKVVRASMGAIFMLNIAEFNCFEDYLNSNNFQKFLFMLDGTTALGSFTPPKQNYALIFGNEAHGIDSKFLTAGTSVVINHSHKIDSLNLPISVGMAVYEFNKNK